MIGRTPKLHSRVVDGVICVWNADPHGQMRLSLTNAAEFVTASSVAQHGDMPLVYEDSEGRWDEMVHLTGQFMRFEPIGGDSAEDAVFKLKVRQAQSSE